MNSSIPMQEYSQTPPAGPKVHAPQHASCSRLPSLLGQVLYCVKQQRMPDQQNNQQSHGLWNDQSCSQHVSSSPNSQSRQVPQTWFTNSQNQLLPGNSSSSRAALPNGQFAQLPAAQHGTPTQNLNYYPQHRNTVPQQNFNMPPMQNVSSTATVPWPPSIYSNARYATEQHQSHQNLTHQSAVPQYQSFSRHHNRMQINHQLAAHPQKTDPPVQIRSNPAQQTIHNNQGQTREGTGNGALYNSSNHFPGPSQRPIAPSQPSNYIHQTGQSNSSYNRNQVQHSSQIQHQPSPYRMENNSASCNRLTLRRKKHQSLAPKLPHPPAYTTQHFIIQNQPRSELSVPHVQPQTPLQQQNTIQVSGHHNTCPSTVPASHGNSQPQALQLNNAVTGPPRSYQVTPSTPTSEATPPIFRESTLNYSQVTLKDLLLDSTQVPAQGHGTSPPSCQKARFTTQRRTLSHVTTQASYSQTPETAPYSSAPVTGCSKELQRVSEYQTPVKRTATLDKNEHTLANQLKAQDGRSTEVMQNRRLQNNKGNEMNGHESSNGHGELQYCEDIAETQELVMALQKVLRQSHKAVAVVPPISQQVPSPQKNNHVTKSSDDGLPFKIDVVWTLVKDSKNVEQESNAPSLPKVTNEELLHLTQEHNKPEDGSTVDSSIPDAQSTDIPQSKTGSATSQDPACSTVLTSKSPEYNEVKCIKIQVCNFTLEKLNKWVETLEGTQEGKVKEPVADVEKLLLDLYWGGNTQNVLKQVHAFTAELSDLSSEVSQNNLHTANFQYVQPQDLKMLADGYHILKNDTSLPAEEFRSSWLNVDGQPADVEMVLAEPLVDITYPDAFHEGFSALNICSESQASRKVMPATTDCQNDQMINKQLADSQISESKSTDQVSKKQAASEKQEGGNLDEHQQQDVNTSSEESVDTNGMADTMKVSKSQTECEQVCRDVSEDITPFSEIIEQRDLSSDFDSSNDSQLIELSLLSSEDARTLFKEYSGCDLQKKLSQLCQDDTKVSSTPHNESNYFCNPANQIKFTCPHVTDTDWDGEHFCPRCWEETPVLDLDLEETLFSPKGNSPNMSTPPEQGLHDQITQSGKTDSNCTVLSESSSIADSLTSKGDVFEVTNSEPDANPCDAKESCSSLSVNSPVKEPHGPVCNESVGSSLPIEVVSEQTKTQRDEVSTPKSPPSKKVKLARTLEIPAEDGLFTADIVTNKASATKPHLSNLNVTSAGQNCQNEMKEIEEENKSPTKMKTPINAQCPQSNCTVLSESCSIADSLTPKVAVFKVTNSEPDPHPSDAVDSCSSSSGNSLVKEPHGPLCIKSVGFSLPIEGAVCETNRLMGPELPKALSCTQNIENPVVPEQTTSPRAEVSPPKSPSCKRVKLSTTTDIPAKDDLFAADIVTKKASTTKPHPSDLGFTPAEDGQNCKDEKKEIGEERKSPIKMKIQMNAQCLQSGKPDPNVNVGLENRRHSTLEQDPKNHNSLQSYRSPSGKSLDKQANGRVSSASVRVSVPIEVCDRLSGAELPKALYLAQNTENRKPVIQPQTKRPSKEGSPPTYPPCKKQKLTKTISEPAKDDLFTPDIVVKKFGSPKPYSSVTPTKDYKNKRKERGEDRNSSIILKIRHQHSGQTKSNAHGKWLKPFIKSQGSNVTLQPTKPDKAGQKKGMKKIQFAPYGFNNGHNRSKLSALPVYIKTNRPEIASGYTDMSSAKQKVYSQWSRTFVQPKMKRKHQKHVHWN